MDQARREQGAAASRSKAAAPVSDSSVPATPAVEDLRRLHLWEIQAVRDLLVVASVLALIWLGHVLRSVTVPLLVALLLAYLFEPLVSRYAARPGMRRSYVVSGLMIGLLIAIGLSLAVAVPLIVGQTVELVRDLRTGRGERTMLAVREYVPASFRDEYDRTVGGLGEVIGLRYRPPVPPPATTPASAAATAPDSHVPPPGFSSDQQPRMLTEEEIRDLVRIEVENQLASREGAPAAGPVSVPGTSVPSRSIGTIWQMSRAGVAAMIGFLAKVLEIGFLFFLIPFYFFFFSLWYPQVLEFGRNLIPYRNREQTLQLLAKMDHAVAGFVRGRIVICLLIAIMCAIGWTFCQVPYAIVLGVITGVFCLVPYLGFVGLPIAILLLWVDQLANPPGVRMSALWIIGGPTIVYIAMQIIETYILTPLIAGKATNLDPVTILVAVLAGGSIAGVYGMLLAIPVAACLKILLTDVLMPSVRLWVKGRAEDPLPL